MVSGALDALDQVGDDFEEDEMVSLDAIDQVGDDFDEGEVEPHQLGEESDEEAPNRTPNYTPFLPTPTPPLRAHLLNANLPVRPKRVVSKE